MKSFISLVLDMCKMQPKWIAWVCILIAVNLGGGFFFISTLEGKMAVSFMLIGTGIMTYLHSKYGFVRLLGAAHILWLYLVPHFLNVYMSLKPSHFKGWLFMAALFNGISLIIDIFDIIKYVKGDKDSILK